MTEKELSSFHATRLFDDVHNPTNFIKNMSKNGSYGVHENYQ